MMMQFSWTSYVRAATLGDMSSASSTSPPRPTRLPGKPRPDPRAQLSSAAPLRARNHRRGSAAVERITAVREAGIGGSTGLVAVQWEAVTLDRGGLEELAGRHATGSLAGGARSLDLTTSGDKVQVLSHSMRKRRAKAIDDAIDRIDALDNAWADPANKKLRDERVAAVGQQAAQHHEDNVARRGQRIARYHQTRQRKAVGSVPWLAIGVIAAFAAGPFGLLIGIPGAIKALRAVSLTARIGWNQWRSGHDTTLAARARVRAEQREERAQEQQHEARKSAVAKELLRRMSAKQGMFRRPGDLAAIMDVDAKGGVIVDAVEAKVAGTRQAALDKNRTLIEAMTRGAVITHASGDPRMRIDTSGGGRLPDEALGRIAEAITLGSRRENIANLDRLANTGTLELSGGYSIQLDVDPNSPARRVTDRVADQARITRDDEKRYRQDQRRVKRMHSAGVRQREKNQALAVKQEAKAEKRQAKAEELATKREVKAARLEAKWATRAEGGSRPGRVVAVVQRLIGRVGGDRGRRAAALDLGRRMAAARIPARDSRHGTGPADRPFTGRPSPTGPSRGRAIEGSSARASETGPRKSWTTPADRSQDWKDGPPTIAANGAASVPSGKQSASRPFNKTPRTAGHDGGHSL